MFVSVLIRHYFVLRHKGRNDWWLMAVAGVITAGVFWWLLPAPSAHANDGSQPIVTMNEIEPIIRSRCEPCHGDHPTLVPIAPKNLSFSKREAIESSAALIYMQVVQQQMMPIGNITNMTDDERLAIKYWFESK